MLQQFLIQGRFIAEAPRNPVRECNPLFRTSAHYYCERCGEIYATVLVSPSPYGWTTYRGHCESCPPFPSVFLPGSIWRDWDREFLLSLPAPILQRELFIHLKHLEK